MMNSGDLNQALAEALEGSFEGLVLAFQDRIYRFALRYCGSREDAEEIAQDTFVRAFHALRGYSPERRRELNLRPWLYTIALDVARNRTRRWRPFVTSLDDTSGSGTAAFELEDHSEALHPPATVERQETANELVQAIATLPPRYRAAVVLRHIEGLSYAEIAQTLDQPVGTAKASVHRGVKILRDYLATHELAGALPLERTGQHDE